MRFDGPLWQYFKSHPRGPWEQKSGLTSIFLPEPFYLKFFLEMAPAQGARFLRPQDLTNEFLTNEYQSLGLFQTEEMFVVTEAHDLSNEAKKALVEGPWDFSNKGLVLFFSRKNATWESALKKFADQSYRLAPFKFWEFPALFDFITQRLELKVSIQVRHYLEESLEEGPAELYQALHFLKLCFPQKGYEVSFQEAEAMIQPMRLDFFELARLLSNKKEGQLLDKLLSTRASYESLRKVFSSLQGHLLKLGDPSYAQKKGKLAKYDQEVVAKSGQWTRAEIVEKLGQYFQWEILAKEKDEFLLTDLRRKKLEYSN